VTSQRQQTQRQRDRDRDVEVKQFEKKSQTRNRLNDVSVQSIPITQWEHSNERKTPLQNDTHEINSGMRNDPSAK
jgi:hypothetical protein